MVGFVLLSLGLVAGMGIGTPGNAFLHLGWPLVTWLVYAFLVQAKWGLLWKLAPRQLAKGSIVAFSVALLTLWGLTFVNTPRPAASILSPAGPGRLAAAIQLSPL